MIGRVAVLGALATSLEMVVVKDRIAPPVQAKSEAHVYFLGHLAFADTGNAIHALLPNNMPKDTHDVFVTFENVRGQETLRFKGWQSIRFSWSNGRDEVSPVRRRARPGNDKKCVGSPSNPEDAAAACWIAELDDLHPGLKFKSSFAIRDVPAHIEISEGMLQTSDLLEWRETAQSGVPFVTFRDSAGQGTVRARKVVADGAVLVMRPQMNDAILQMNLSWPNGRDSTITLSPKTAGPVRVQVQNLSRTVYRKPNGRPCALRRGVDFESFYGLLTEIPANRLMPVVERTDALIAVPQPLLRNRRKPPPLSACPDEKQVGPQSPLNRPICPFLQGS